VEANLAKLSFKSDTGSCAGFRQAFAIAVGNAAVFISFSVLPSQAQPEFGSPRQMLRKNVLPV
jgi:hypothetical protein